MFRRNGLVQAISGRNSKQLAFLLNFIVRYIGVRKLSKTLTHVASTVIGEYIIYILLVLYLNYIYIYMYSSHSIIRKTP